MEVFVAGNEDYSKERFYRQSGGEFEGGQETGGKELVLRKTAKNKSGIDGTVKRTSSKHKSSHLRFLTWVAYDRKYSPKIKQHQRRTCPLVDCETIFDNEEQMLRHITECPYLSRGVYRCFECQKAELIGTYHIDNCQVSQCLDRFATVANSLRNFRRRRSLREVPIQLPESDHIDQNQSAREEFEQYWTTQSPKKGTSYTAPGHYEELEAHELLELENCQVEEMSSPFPMQHTWIPNDRHELQANDNHPDMFYYGHEQRQLEPVELDVGCNYIHEMWSSNGANVGAPTRTGSNLECPVVDDFFEESGSRQFTPVFPIATVMSHNERSTLQEGNHVGPSAMMTSWSHIQPRGSTQQQVTHLDTNPSFPTVGPPTSFKTCRPICEPIRTQSITYSPTESHASASTGSGKSIFSDASDFSSVATSLSSYEPYRSPIQNHEDGSTRYLDVMDPDAFFNPRFIPLTGGNQEHPDSSFADISEIMPGAQNKLETTCNSFHRPLAPSCIASSRQIQPHSARCKVSRPHKSGVMGSAADGPQPPKTKQSPPLIGKSIQPILICDCGYKPSGHLNNQASNLKRHRKTSKLHCHSRPYTCHYPDCGKFYTRPDNLLHHQRVKKHSMNIDLDVPSGSLEWDVNQVIIG